MRHEEKIVSAPSTFPHVGLSVQQSDTEQLEEAHVFVKSEFKWLRPVVQLFLKIPLIVLTKPDPEPSMLLHVGFILQQSLTAQVAATHVIFSAESFKWRTPASHAVKPLHVGLAKQQSVTVHAAVVQVTLSGDGCK